MTNPQTRWLEEAFVNPEEVAAPPGPMTDVDHEVFDRLAFASRMGSDEPSDFEFAVGEQFFMAALDDMLNEEVEKAPEKTTDKTSVESPWIMLVAAIFIGGISAIIISNISQNTEDEFQARSAVDKLENRYAPTEILAFCTHRPNGEIEFKPLAMDPRCGIGDELKLAYVAPDSALRYGYFFGVSEAGKVLWYGPSPATPDPITLKHTATPSPAGETVRLAVNHSPGKVTLVGVFTEEKLEWDVFKRWVEVQAQPLILRGESPSLDRASLSVAHFEVVETE